MSHEPLVSFVVPCYNYGRYLRDCLDSILGQEGGYQDLEIIAIDDCSNDDTRDILASYQDRRLRVIHHAENRGHVYTVNEGFDLARGRYVARIDPDDRYRRCFLQVLLPRLEANANAGMAYGDAAIIDANGAVTLPRTASPHGGRETCGNELLMLLEENHICAPTAIARREAWRKGLPIWEGMAFNDWYLNVMIARDHDLCYVPEVVADYRCHGSNHHVLIIRNRSEEPSILRVLDHVYSLTEARPEDQARKLASRGRVYARQYLTLAEKYFGAGQFADARRCYRQAFRNRPSLLARPGPLRRFGATFLGPARYERLKSLLRSVIGRGPAPQANGNATVP